MQVGVLIQSVFQGAALVGAIKVSIHYPIADYVVW
jgi:hypothetical protein